MRNIQKRHKRIKHINSFINARLQRKPRKFAEKPISGSRVPVPIYELDLESWVLGPTFMFLGIGSWVPPMSWLPGIGSRVPPMSWLPGIGSRVPPAVRGLGSSEMPFFRYLLMCF